MITTSNLADTLIALGFHKEGSKLYGSYNVLDTDAYIEVDLEKQKINYPEGLKINEQQTTNFSDKENFVVLECVYRLLKKGYRPEHIELEKRWQLGHNASGGRADICIYDENGQDVITIIECKTPGPEYNKAYRQLLSDGGQLFSYRQQEGSARWLCLYTSDYQDGKVFYETDVIPAFDDPQKIKQQQTDTTISLYRDAGTVDKLFSVWSETYGKQRRGDLIFDDEASPYNVEILPLRKKHLKAFEEADPSKIVNQFEEVLRHNNISDKENAFNRLIALFICKLVDEYEKGEEDIVDFQYRQGADTYETLQDRLQLLHKKGMEKFMKEEIFYVSSEYPKRLFQNYTSQNRVGAIRELSEIIRKLKYFSNSDFAFKDVHNEDLFMQNGKILVEVVQIFERHRIVYASKHQFLGDLFEQLLSKGFKQNEGQFFTPMPITRFIWDSLPLTRFAQGLQDSRYPRIIDYACGSGHFLTEAVTAVNSVLTEESSVSTPARVENSNHWVKEHIFGIEKDYRLARVSKVSLFMNGAGEGTIIFGDGLDNFPDQGIKNSSFDILVANPPYAVRAFKQHLNLQNNESKVLAHITEQGGDIETVFVERIAQLLKPNGVAAVILPVSFLTNNGAGYTSAREILVDNFMIRAAVQLGSATFAATGTATVVLFLEKYNTPPNRNSLVNDTVSAILSNEDLSDWEDRDIFEKYTQHIKVDADEYKAIVVENSAGFERINGVDYFKAYAEAFEKDKLWKDLSQKTSFKVLNDEEKLNIKLDSFYSYLRKIESNKLHYFSLTYNHQTLIITGPSKNKDQKIFLGYEWSNRKGNEGIKINHPGGMLYDFFNRKAIGTLAAAIRDAYDEREHVLEADKQVYVNVASTAKLFNFIRPNFNNSINLAVDKEITVISIYPLKKLRDFEGIKISKGSNITQENAGKGTIKVVAGGVGYAYLTDRPNRDANVITVSASGANAGFVNFWDEPIWASDCTTIEFVGQEISTRWLYYYLKSIQQQIISTLQRGSSQPHVYPADLQEIPVPVLSLEQQAQIVRIVQDLEHEQRALDEKISQKKQEIDSILQNLDVASAAGNQVRLSDESIFTFNTGKRVTRSQVSEVGDVPVYSANVFTPFGYFENTLFEDFTKEYILWSIDGDWMVNKLDVGQKFYPTDHCGYLSVENEDIVLPRYMQHVLYKAGVAENFDRNKRANLDAISSLVVKIAPIEEQMKFIPRLVELERQIKEDMYELENLEAEISRIIPEFLKGGE